LPAERIVGDFAMLDDVSLRPTPIIDGRALPLHEALSFGRATAANVPLLVGANSWEGSVLASLDLRLEVLASSLGAARDSALARYRDAAARASGAVPRERQMAMLLYGDQVFVAPARHMARVASSRAPTFLYHFSYVTPGQRGNLLGTPHGGELGYVFNALGTIPNQVPSAKDRALAQTVSSYWINFVKTGNPNGPQLPAWPVYSRDQEELLELGDEGPKLRRRFLEERLDVAALGTGDGGVRQPCMLSGECAP
jgi:para-nitrobenzyl esterase